MEPDRSSNFPRHLSRCSIAVAVLILIGLLFYFSTGRDDSHITYWSAYSLASFGEIQNYNTERVEQSSSLLLVLLLAIAHVITRVGVPLLGNLASMAFAAGAVVAVYRLGWKLRPAAAFPAALLAASSAYFVYWAQSGMETTLTALCVLLVVSAHGDYLERPSPGLRGLAWPSAATFLLVSARPEAPFVILAALLGVSVFLLIRSGDRRESLRRVSALLLVSFVTCAALFAFRQGYFGDLFPQPVYAKSGDGIWLRLEGGLSYLAKHVFAYPSVAIAAGTSVVALAAAAIGQIRAERADPRIVVGICFVLAQLGFVAFSGGDWMEAGRFLVPVLPVLALFVALTVSEWSNGRARVATVAALLLVQLWTNVDVSSRGTGSAPWRPGRSRVAVADTNDGFTFSIFERTNYVNKRDIPVVFLVDALVQQILAVKGEAVILCGQMGLVPYHIAMNYRGRVRFIDRNGLTDRLLTDCPVTSGIRRGRFGLALHYSYFFEHRQSFTEDCRVPDVHLIIDRARDRFGFRRDVAANGYEIVHGEDGQGILVAVSEELPGE